MVNSSKLKGKNDHLERISFKDWVFINESMSPGYKYLHYLYCRLLTDRHIHYYQLFNNQFKVKLEERGNVNIIQHIDNFVELSLLLDQCMAWKSILYIPLWSLLIISQLLCYLIILIYFCFSFLSIYLFIYLFVYLFTPSDMN